MEIKLIPHPIELQLSPKEYSLLCLIMANTSTDHIGVHEVLGPMQEKILQLAWADDRYAPNYVPEDGVYVDAGSGLNMSVEHAMIITPRNGL